jgi:apolipoprotein N-acyltransferase
MAVVRGVENGFALVRTAQQGLLTVSDAYGRILGEAASPRTGSAFLVRDVPPGPGATLYSAYGDWFGWGSALALVVLLVVQRMSSSISSKSMKSSG